MDAEAIQITVQGLGSSAEEIGALPWPGQNLLHFQFWKQFVIILQIPLKDLSVPMPGLVNIPAKMKG